MATRAEDLAEAYLAIAKVNHYMVGIVGEISQEDRERTRAILVARENSTPNAQVSLALDLLERDDHRARWRPIANMGPVPTTETLERIVNVLCIEKRGQE